MNRGGVSLAWVVVAVVVVGATISSLYIFDFGGDEGTLDENEISSDENEDLYLSDYPEVFSEDSLVVVGDNASPVVEESAEIIAGDVENRTGHRPEIRKAGEISEDLRSNHNLIVVGTPENNEFLDEVYDRSDATRVTENYPGDNQGFLEILNNPWNREKAILLIEGDKRCRVIAAVSKLLRIKELNKSSTIVPSALKSVNGIVKKVSYGSAVAWLIETTQGEKYFLVGKKSQALIKKGSGTKVRLTGYVENVKLTIPEAGEFHTYTRKAFIVTKIREVK